MQAGPLQHLSMRNLCVNFRPVFLSVCLSLMSAPRSPAVQAAPLLTDSPGATDFVLAGHGNAAAIRLERETDKSVRRAAVDLAADIERVTGIRPQVGIDATTPHGLAVIIGVLGHSPLIDNLAAAGKLDTSGVRGQWESFVIQVVDSPAPGVAKALVIAGSDRRGAIYGIYEVSESIGVSPWYWWADVPVAKRSQLAIRAGAHKQGPPSVKYRGIFLNDEDWGLQPWAAKTFEPEIGDIGPRTYAKIAELLLRLKANTLWPAMHPCTKAFNLYPPNKLVADEYGIVMGSSHAEPMLRNNVTEWTAPHEDYNYVTNRDGVHAYWEKRVEQNARFENIYTLGMRGIHDSGMVGPTTDSERIRVLEQIFADQRALLAKYVNPDVTQVPQAFTPYKEVLDIYNAGLRVPDDVTLVWPDDNFGYIRHFPTPAEQQRPGGSGVYYHLSYLGRPMSYLWLYTTPPALVWEEMSKAYDNGARTIWIVNVGDLKPGEIGTEFFLQMAWDANRWRRENLPEFLVSWAAREFGAEHAGEIAAVMDEYYLLNFQRKPEHLQWWLPNETPRPSPLTADECQQRIEAFGRLQNRVDKLSAELPETEKDAFYELVAYPVRGAALANERYFDGELASIHSAARLPDAAALEQKAQAADAQLKQETSIYNERVAGGKWRHIIALEPADDQWASMRIAPWRLPRFESVPPTKSAGTFMQSPESDGFREIDGVVSIEAAHFSGRTDRDGIGWQVVPGLGRTGHAVAIFPTTAASIAPDRLAGAAPDLEYNIDFASAGPLAGTVYLVPTHPIRAGEGLRCAVGLDDQPPQLVGTKIEAGSAEWSHAVLDATATGTVNLKVATPGFHLLKLYMVDPGVVVDKIVLDAGDLRPSYLGPPETRGAR